MANTTANNILQQVQTYQMAHLAYLENQNCFVATANTKFKDFEKLVGNLGDTVTFDLPPRMTVTNSLVANFQPADQRVQNLVCNQPFSVSYAFSSQQFIFNVENYMANFGKSAVKNLSAKVEAEVARNCVTNTYRFFGDGVNPINSFAQLANALALFRNYGAATDEAKCYISDTATPNIISSGQNQFTLDRGNRTALSWELGKFKNSEWYESNLLPVHTAGTEGQQAAVLTVVSFTNNGPQGAIDTITFSGTHAANDPSSVLKYDKFQFQDGVANQPNLRFLTFIGYIASSNPVQFQVTADAASTAGSQVTVSVNPPLQSASTNNQNLNYPIVAGMQVKALPSHRSGLICAGNPLYLAMPRLPDQSPFYTGNEVDPDTGVSVRLYYGATFGQNQMGMVHDCIMGSTLVPEYSMALIFPL